jgi:hypothetical protein
MKLLIFVGIFFWAAFSFGQEKATEYKNWKTFRSDYGFEFKYPDCWELKGNSPDEPPTPTAKSKDLVAKESVRCKTPLLNPPHENMVKCVERKTLIDSKTK